MSNWISVKNRLPEIFEDVLVTDGVDVEIACWDGDEFDTGPCEYVTHWQPLPEPPEEA